MREHALDREVGLAGVGGSKHRGDAGAACAGVAVARRREGNCHFGSGKRKGPPPFPSLFMYHNATGGKPVIKLWNESRTNRGRIADSPPVGFRSLPYLAPALSEATTSGKRHPGDAADLNLAVNLGLTAAETLGTTTRATPDDPLALL